ncbi:hypothetical protein PFDG_05124 [Plasmodium falciparum Dd2]|uniref:Uncharacterized protein n=1 Tax=Plasmodium falciparum (isolate Dd2) TaxID=57267 RepID=A0A0L7M9M6_PLAF4|nr:hypothetical protein PFDG_05124 [Plasmodium falciparum Dd2]
MKDDNSILSTDCKEEKYYFYNLIIEPHNILLYLLCIIDFKLNEVLCILQKSSSVSAQEYFCDYFLCYIKYLLILKKKT